MRGRHRLLYSVVGHLASGALLGTLFGSLALWRERAEGQAEVLGVGVGVKLAVAAAVGAAMGGLLFLLRDIRRSGRKGHYLAWALSGAGGFLCFGVAGVVQGQPLSELAILPLFGIGAGLGFGVLARLLEGHEW